jgi:hypothetical protein
MKAPTPIIAATMLALAACGRGGNGADRQANQAAPPAPAPANITIATPEGTAEIRTGAGAALPAGLPAYPGAQPNAAVEVSGGAPQNQGGIYGFRTSDPPAQVIAFYAEAARRGGYTIANELNMGATATLTAQKGPGEAVNITATQAGGATQVQLIVALNQR